jgi:glycosyltransferase involved in cell wall biosynthesis
MTKKRILFIETGSGYGGTGKYLFELLKRLDCKIFEPYVIYSSQAPNIEKIRELGISTQKIALNFQPIDYPILKYLHLLLLMLFVVFPNALRVLSVVKKNKIDLVYLNNEIHSHFSSIIAAKIAARPVICHNHGLRGLTSLERIFARWIDHFICVSGATYEAMIKDVIGRPIEVVYNGLDIKDYDLEHMVLDEQIKDLRQKGPLVGIFGRIVEWKGHLNFVRAAAILVQQNTDLIFVIVGNDFSEKKIFLEKIRAEICALGIQDRVIFLGWKENVREVIYGIDIIVHPSIQPEPFGLAIIEAMALQRPIVASRLGAIPEIIDDEEDGFLFKSDSIEDLAEKIMCLYKNSEMRKIFGVKGRLKIAEKFDIKTNIHKIEKIIYEEVSR